MPAFSAIGAYVAGTLLGLTGSALTIAGVGLSLGGALVASVVAAGVASVASRLINGGGSSSGGGGTQQDPGVRVQLPPATDNKVPVVYGTANTKGTVTDARISDDNQQMTYVLVLSEKTQTGTFTVGDIYWNDQLLTFDTGSNNHKVASSTDQNGLGTSSTNFAGLIEMRVYAGSAQSSASQIFPTTNQVSAASYIGESTSTYLMSDLVYAVIKLTYSSEKSVTSLAQMTFEVTNSLKNPGLVMYDYLTSPRYGAGFDATQIDTLSITSTVTNTSLYSISNEIPPNQFESNGTTTSTQARYIINGVISTGETVKNNLEKISQASSSWLTYDFGQGKWSVIVNRALSVGELANVVTYDDDSILGEITVNATNLEDLYNAIEVEFPSREIRDQNDYYRAEIDPAERNDLEPDNKLSLRYDLINNSIHAQRLGLIELNQSRIDKSIQFRTDYSGLQTKAGDVIKVTNEVYGFTEKLFRVTRVREIENEDGSLFAEITGLEYDANVYGDSSITDYQPNTASGIPSFGGSTSLPIPGIVSFTNAYPSDNQPYFTVQTYIDASSGPIDKILWYYSTSSGGTNLVYITDEVGPFYGGQTVNDTIVGLPTGNYFLYAKAVKDGLVSNQSPNGFASLPPVSPPYNGFTNGIDWRPTPGGVSSGTISTSTFSSQVQIVNTTSGSLKIPLVATTSGYQPVYADSELSYDAASNVLSAGGLALSTGTVVQKVVSSGGFPLNSAGTASIYIASGASPSFINSNYSGGLVPSIHIRGYGQNRPSGTASTPGAPNIYIESSYGTAASPTAYAASQSLGGFIAEGYDGANWPSYYGQAYNYLGWFSTEAMTNNGSTSTLQAGSGFNIFSQPQWTRPGINSTRQRWMFQNWTTSTTGPSQLNLNIGAGVTSGASDWPTTATMIMVDGTTYTGFGRSNISFINSAFNIIGVPQQDTAPDNVTLTATNAINFISGRRSAQSGRRNIIQTGDTIGIINFSGQTADNATGGGSQSASITASALETFGASARGGQLSFRTVSSGTTSISNRMDLTDRQIGYNSDTHLFRDKSATFQAAVMTTATFTVNGALNAPGTYHCEVGRQTSDQAITAGANTATQFNKVISDPQSWYNASTYRITPTVAGYYLVNYQVAWTKASAYANQQNIQIQKNGTTVALAQEPVYISTSTANLTQSTFAIVQLNGSTDYVTGTVYTDGTGQSLISSSDGAWTKIALTKLQ